MKTVWSYEDCVLAKKTPPYEEEDRATYPSINHVPEDVPSPDKSPLPDEEVFRPYGDLRPTGTYPLPRDEPSPYGTYKSGEIFSGT